PVQAVSDISFTVKKGQILGLVGESGCGKSVTALSIMRLLPKPAGFVEKGRILFHGADLVHLPAEKMHQIRGRKISMIFQEPMTALNPVHKIGRQIMEVFRLINPKASKDQCHKNAVAMLKGVGIPEPSARMNEYPHQISGGMRQRVMIAMALAGEPEILIADEPTTALDVTIQAQILDLILELQSRIGMSVIFITHDMGVIAEVCDEVVVMYAGRLAEKANIAALFTHPRHPYTKGLLASIPRLETPRKTLLPTIEGTVPSLNDLPTGCRFQNRCPEVKSICRQTTPSVYGLNTDHWVSCYLYQE
ncbi:MAG: ABC transporter ATP-binding protein, partial [Desulfobacteraceae bacterium]